MEVKAWEYDEYPGLTEEVEGAVHIPTTGDEPGVYHWHDIPYSRSWSHTREMSRRSFIRVLYLCRVPHGDRRMFIRAARIMQDLQPAAMWLQWSSTVIRVLHISRHRSRMREMPSASCACMPQSIIWMERISSWADALQAVIPQYLQHWQIRSRGWMLLFIRAYLQM